MKNCIAQNVRFIDTENRVVLTLPAAETPALAVRGEEESIGQITVDGVTIPVTLASPVTEIRHIPEGDVLVPLVVAEAMRARGERHSGRVYTPTPLVFGVDANGQRVILGTEGVYLHEDISAEED
jgi:hypothetical protein